MYLMHFVQPATAMLPGLISSSSLPKSNSFVRPVESTVPDHTHTVSLPEDFKFIQASRSVSASLLQTPPL